MNERIYGPVTWAELLLPILDAEFDSRTVDEWAHFVAAAPNTLRHRCAIVGLPAKNSLDLARVLRAVHLSSAIGGPIERLLDVRDPRTLARLLARAGLAADQRPSSSANVLEFLDRQKFIADPVCLNELKRLLQARLTLKA